MFYWHYLNYLLLPFYGFCTSSILIIINISHWSCFNSWFMWTDKNRVCQQISAHMLLWCPWARQWIIIRSNITLWHFHSIRILKKKYRFVIRCSERKQLTRIATYFVWVNIMTLHVVDSKEHQQSACSSAKLIHYRVDKVLSNIR